MLYWTAIAVCIGYLLVRWSIRCTAFEFRNAIDGQNCANQARFFELLVENSLDIITVLDARGLILFDNRATERCLGYQPEEQVGRIVSDFVHPDDREAVQAVFYALVERPTEIANYVFRYQHKDGSWRWLESNATNLLHDPAVGGIVVNSRDVTAQKEAEAALHESEQRFRSSFEDAPIGMALLSPHGKWLSVNRALCEILGYSQKEMERVGTRDVTHPDDYESSLAIHREMMAGASNSYQIEKRYLHKNGQVVWVRANVSVMRESDGSPKQVIAQIQDITERRIAEQALRESESRFRQLTENIDDVFWIRDVQPRAVVYVSEAFNKTWGRSRKNLLQNPDALLDWVHPDDRDALAAKLLGMGSQSRYTAEYRIVRPDGEVRWISDRGFPVLDDQGHVYRFAGIAEDVTERRAREEQVSKLTMAVQESPAEVVVTDASGIIEFVNPRFTEVTGYTAEEVLGKNPRLLKSDQHDPAFYRELWDTIRAGRTWRGELCNRKKDGTLYWESASISAVRNSHGEITNFVAVKEDITPRKETDARIAQMAFYDALTGLANRVQLQDRLKQAVPQARRRKQLLALHYIDLDRFKVVNDTLGHSVGDALLQAVAERLRHCVRESDTAARIGGDEFAVLQPDVDSQEGAANLARRILKAMAPPFKLAGRDIHISPSIGVSMFPVDSGGAQQLLQHADMAMYLAKKEGRNNVKFFTAELYERVRDKLALESDLHAALKSDQLRLQYQPQVDLRTQRLTGIEALIRWHHPTRGLIPPGDFISVAEECGLIGSLSRWVLQRACVQNAEWQAAGLPPCRIAVNISAADFQRGDLCETVAEALARSGLAPEYLELEVTESMLLQDEQILEAVPKLRAMGVAMSIDDFGTGYSSLNYLRRLPVNKLKIDASFIRGLQESADDVIIAGAIVELGHAMGLSVLAEGIETKEQVLCLRSKGCDEGQGYFFGRPMDADAFASLLQSERNRRPRQQVGSLH